MVAGVMLERTHPKHIPRTDIHHSGGCRVPAGSLHMWLLTWSVSEMFVALLLEHLLLVGRGLGLMHTLLLAQNHRRRSCFLVHLSIWVHRWCISGVHSTISSGLAALSRTSDLQSGRDTSEHSSHGSRAAHRLLVADFPPPSIHRLATTTTTHSYKYWYNY